MFTVMIISIVIIIVVAILTIIAISKGYSIEQTVDPMPREEDDKDEKEDSTSENDRD